MIVLMGVDVGLSWSRRSPSRDGSAKATPSVLGWQGQASTALPTATSGSRTEHEPIPPTSPACPCGTTDVSERRRAVAPPPRSQYRGRPAPSAAPGRRRLPGGLDPKRQRRLVIRLALFYWSTFLLEHGF